MKIQVTHLHDQDALLILGLPKKGTAVIKYTFTTPDGKTEELPGEVNQKLTVPNGTTGTITYSTRFVSHKKNKDGELMEHSAWLRLEETLTENMDEWDGYFPNLDEEYQYKKFRADWYENVYSEEIKVEDIEFDITNHVKFETGNPYITSLFSIGCDPARAAYVYNRKGALFGICSDVMKSLGLVYEHKLNYEKTRDKKIWSGDELRWVVAFGTYIFDDSVRCDFNPTGTLEKLIAYYESDVKFITDRIKVKYASHFTNEVMDGIKIKHARNEVSRAYEILRKVDVKRSGENDRNVGLKVLRELLAELDSELIKSAGI